MRAGPEQFIYRDFAFIDAMIMPVIGPRTIAIYDVLRRHVWRSLSRGSKRSRAAFESGKLSASIGRQKIADLSGVSVRTVQRHLNRLQAVKWVRWESGNGTGETVVFELGFRTAEGAEVFYADASARRLWLGLEELAADSDVERVNDLPCDVRMAFAQSFLDPEGGGDKNVTREVTEMSPGVVTEMAPTIENPPGGGIEKAEKSPGRAAPDGPTGPEPKHWAGPDNERRRRSRPSKKKGVLGSFNEQDQEEGLAEFALDKEGGSGQDGEDRLARAAEAAAGAGKKADDQAAANARRRLRRQRTEKLEQVTAKESKAQNLKGRHAPDVVKAARKAWDVYKHEIEALDDGFVVPKWNAKGNAKARGQICGLVDMYGGELTEQAIRYVVGNWDKIGERYFKSAPGGVPNLGRLIALHEQLFREATVWGRHREVLDEWRAWFEEHRYDEASPPAGLQERYDEARTALESLGLGG